MSVFPYRWTVSTVHRNLWSFVADSWIGIWNVARWAPVIWKDRDFDHYYLQKVMEYKLRRMAAVFDNGHLKHCERRAKQCRTAANLLQRLIADEYDAGWRKVPESVLGKFWEKSELKARNDQKYLGRIIGRHMAGWWD